MELGEHEIIFKPRTNIKAQALVDFITEIACQKEVSSIHGADDNIESIDATQENQ